MVSNEGSGKPTTRRYSPEENAAAVRMVRTLRAELGTEHGTVQRVATQLGYGIESVRTWVKQADIDDGNVAGVTTAESRKLRELEQEVRELRRANEMADSTDQRNGCCGMKQTLISGGIGCRASMVISVVSRSSSRSVSNRRDGDSSTSLARSGARRRWSAAWRGKAVTSTGNRSAGSRARII